MAELLEVTITHNLDDAAEVSVLFERQLIALDWGRLGPDPNAYTGRARTDVKLFHKMRRDGAAVIAAYKKASAKASDRLIGRVDVGAQFERVNDLLCLPLSGAQIVDSSANFLGNLAPRGCTVQPCGNRAKGRLAALVLSEVSPRAVWSLHHHDVEWLVANYLIAKRICECVWSGARAFENIDHAGLTANGRELLAQTTVSGLLVGTKAGRLLSLARDDRDLHFFGPAASAAQCPPGIIYHSIESVFAELDQTTTGQWLINRMLGIPDTTDETQ